MRDSILIVPAAAVFFLTFAVAIAVSVLAFFLLLLSFAAWKPYAMCGGGIPRVLAGMATKCGFIVDHEKLI